MYKIRTNFSSRMGCDFKRGTVTTSRVIKCLTDKSRFGRCCLVITVRFGIGGIMVWVVFHGFSSTEGRKRL